MHVSLNEHLTGKKIFFAVIAPICMMVFSSLYSVVDGVFISTWVNVEAFAGNNLVWPYFAVLSSVGFMLGTGGSALVGKYLGQKRMEKANRTFSFLIWVVAIAGVVLGIIGFFTMRPFAEAMASLSASPSDQMVNYGVIYGCILSVGMPAYMLQLVFQSFFAVAEKPLKGFAFTFAAGMTNIALDALFMGVFHWGVEGAALATILGHLIGGIGPIVYFFFAKNTPIRFVKTSFDGRALWKSASNGISELISNVSASILAICYNVQLLRYVGSDGVSAYGVIQYFAYVFIAVFIGYSIGVAPFIAYNYGAQNKEELHHIFKRSLVIVGISGVCMFLLAEFAGPVLAKAFAADNVHVAELASSATKIYAFVFLTCGFSMFGSAFFTALNNGIVSGVISAVRTMVLEIAAVFLVPLLLSVDGIWASAVFAEIGSLCLTVFFFIKEKKRYGY